MNQNKILKGKKFLMVSSLAPWCSADYGNDIAGALKSAGAIVDYLTVVQEMAEDSKILPDKLIMIDEISVFELIPLLKNPKKWGYLINKLFKSNATKIENSERVEIVKSQRTRFLKLWDFVCKTASAAVYRTSTLWYPHETRPEVGIKSVVNNIYGTYDAVISAHWNGMLTSETLVEIHNKLQCPIIIGAVDMAPMTGRCFYFGECRNFTHGCGNCPKIRSIGKYDPTHWNYLRKKRNYEKSDATLMANPYMLHFAKLSGLFREDRMAESMIIINPDDFSPCERTMKRDKFRILLRSARNPRKGSDLMLQAVVMMKEMLPAGEREKVVVQTIGDDYFDNIAKDTGVAVENLHFVNKEKLIECYREADVFLCLSLDDAGPSMINQSMMCGTPVVSFNSGTAWEMVTDGETGYKSEPGDVEKIADGLVALFNMSEEERCHVSATARQRALDLNSPSSFASRIARVLNQYKN